MVKVGYLFIIITEVSKTIIKHDHKEGKLQNIKFSRFEK
jgi:hypothetical protein